MSILTKKEQRNQKRIFIICLIILVWAVPCSLTQRFKCPKMTETELFLSLPKNLIFQFNDCNGR